MGVIERVDPAEVGLNAEKLKLARRDALVMQQLLALHVRDRRVRKDQLPGGKPRFHALRFINARPKKGDLKAEFARACPGVPGDIPPFGPKVRVAAMVSGKHQRFGRQCMGIQRAAKPGKKQGATQRAGGWWQGLHSRIVARIGFARLVNVAGASAGFSGCV